MIPFLDLRAINLRNREDFHLALDNVLDKGSLILGSELECLKKSLHHIAEQNLALVLAMGLMQSI